MVVGCMEETKTEGNNNDGYLGNMLMNPRASWCIKASDIAQNVKELGREPHIFLSIIYFSSTFNRVR